MVAAPTTLVKSDELRRERVSLLSLSFFTSFGVFFIEFLLYSAQYILL
jgi:hypothetical protein